MQASVLVHLDSLERQQATIHHYFNQTGHIVITHVIIIKNVFKRLYNVNYNVNMLYNEVVNVLLK